MSIENDTNRIYIRADMNEEIATGHVMRCLSIADAAKELGRETVFITADENPVELLQRRGYETIVLHTDWKKQEEELEVFLPLILKRKINKLFIDSYQVTEKYLRRLGEVTEVFYLDDIDNFEYPVKNIICYANYYSKLSYKDYRSKPNFYLGTAYMPIRKAYQNCKAKRIKERIENILVLSGGSDHFHMLEHIVEMFKRETQVQVNAVCGIFYPNFESVKEKFKNYENIHFYQNVSNLDEFMERADLAISAGGTTLYELCAKGVPAISYSFADNQLKNVKQFEEDGMIAYAGDARKDTVYESISRLWEKYQNPQLRQEVSKKMQSVIDGKGAERIARLLM